MNDTPDMSISPLQAAQAAMESTLQEEVKEVPVEEKPKEVVPEKPKEDISAKRFEELTKLDRKNRRERQEIEQAKKLVSEDRAKNQKIMDAFANAKQDPFAFLEAGGLTYEELIAKGLQNDPQAKGLTTIEQKLEAMEKREKEREQNEITRQQEHTINVFKNEIDAHINKNEELKVIKTFGSSDIVYNVVEEYFKLHEKVLSIEEACKMVEDGLRAQVKEEYKKLQTLNLDFLENSSQPSETQAPVSQNQTKTLTNNAFASPDRREINDDSKEARLKQAIAAMNG